MTVSALAGVFREVTLEYDVATGTGTDSDGDPIETGTTAELVINFEPARSSQLIFREGADPKVVPGKAYCMNPSTLPGALGPGSELDMTYAGTTGKLRILSVLQEPLELLDEVLGQELAVEWRAT